MKILVNASNLAPQGGAAQVADSICKELCNFKQHSFVVVLPSSFRKTQVAIRGFDNIVVMEYSYPCRDWHSLLTCRNVFLDSLVANYQIECVLTIFGPTKWVPKCKHLCGFALPHIPLSDSPYFKNMPLKSRMQELFRRMYMTYLFKRCSKVFFTENPYITELVKKKLHCKDIYTVTNNYNQIFDKPEQWEQMQLPSFDGIRIFSASSMMPHKNLLFTIYVAQQLKAIDSDFSFQFVLTVSKSDFAKLPDNLTNNFIFTDSVHISQIPSLYSQCDIVLQPSLLECFSASYPEAMKMGKPLIVPDLPFTRGLCGNAAAYYSPTSAEECANEILSILKGQLYYERLVSNGLVQLNSYDTYKQRAEKLIRICERL